MHWSQGRATEQNVMDANPAKDVGSVTNPLIITRRHGTCLTHSLFQTCLHFKQQHKAVKLTRSYLCILAIHLVTEIIQYSFLCCGDITVVSWNINSRYKASGFNDSSSSCEKWQCLRVALPWLYQGVNLNAFQVCVLPVFREHLQRGIMSCYPWIFQVD